MESQPKSKASMSEDAAATKIQSVWRGRQARKEVAVMRQQTAEGKKHQEELKASLWSNTSSMESQPKCKASMSEDAAATKIQSVWRGRQARKEVAVIRQQTAEGKKHQEALKASLWSNTSSMESQPKPEASMSE